MEELDLNGPCAQPPPLEGSLAETARLESCDLLSQQVLRMLAISASGDQAGLDRRLWTHRLIGATVHRRPYPSLEYSFRSLPILPEGRVRRTFISRSTPFGGAASLPVDLLAALLPSQLPTRRDPKLSTLPAMLTRRSNRVLVQGKAITRFSIEHTSEPNVSPPPPTTTADDHASPPRHRRPPPAPPLLPDGPLIAPSAPADQTTVSMPGKESLSSHANVAAPIHSPSAIPAHCLNQLPLDGETRARLAATRLASVTPFPIDGRWSPALAAVLPEHAPSPA